MPSQGRRILITGSAKRVGAAITRALHQAGERVIIHYRNSADQAQALAAELNAIRTDSATTLQGDLLDWAALPRLIEEAAARFDGLDALVNNASSFYPTALGEIDETAWDELVGSNFRAPLLLTQAAAPYLRAACGAVVNITDIHAERPLRGYLLYCAAKAALAGLTRALALELSPQVRVNAVAPGAILWPEDGQLPAPEREAIVDHVLLRRTGNPQHIAATVRFLLTEGVYITGQVINVDGGRSIHI